MEVADADIELGNIEELELKYCARCGGLWLRLKGCRQVYCSPCVPKMAEFAVAKKRPGRARLPIARRLDLQAVIDETADFFREGALA
jgi:Zn-finger nucleic acid-binding protein